MRNILFLTMTLSLAMFISCDEADSFDVRQDALVDYVTDINGTWTLHSVHRDGTDITSHIPSATGLTLQVEAGSFTLGSSNLPFPTLGNARTPFSSGSWSFDDDYQPTSINFTNGTDVIVTSLAMPLYASNNSSMGLTFSMGCGATSYQYNFKK